MNFDEEEQNVLADTNKSLMIDYHLATAINKEHKQDVALLAISTPKDKVFRDRFYGNLISPGISNTLYSSAAVKHCWFTELDSSSKAV